MKSRQGALLLSILLLSAPTLALPSFKNLKNTQVCESFLGLTFSHFIKAEIASVFKPLENVLFVSDGARTRYGLGELSDPLLEAFPQLKITRSDLLAIDDNTSEHLKIVGIDNTKKFPFADNTFDMILMKRGLCSCSRLGNTKNKLCCGVELSSNGLTHFFTELIRVLNKNSPQGGIFLQGYYPFHKIALLKTILDTLCTQYNCRYFLPKDAVGDLVGLGIMSKNARIKAFSRAHFYSPR